ncbi:hypothetical protein [Tropicibacter sp. S64]|uniref:hypothetical protein n=1 Tax=Tropicibacter sp. S64 TaxID=3415122 RepID=UPI003C7C9BE5
MLLLCGLAMGCDGTEPYNSERFEANRAETQADIAPVVSLRILRFTEPGRIEAELTNASEQTFCTYADRHFNSKVTFVDPKEGTPVETTWVHDDFGAALEK